MDEDCVRSCFSASESESGLDSALGLESIDLDANSESIHEALEGDDSEEGKGKGKEEGNTASTEWSCIANSVSLPVPQMSDLWDLQQLEVQGTRCIPHQRLTDFHFCLDASSPFPRR